MTAADPRWAVFVLLALLVSGCVRPDEPEPAPEGVAQAALGVPPAPTTGALSVLAVFADRTPLAGVNVSVANQSRTTDSAGTARFDALPVGAHTLTATKAAHRAALQQVEVEPGREAQVEVVLAAEEGGQHAHQAGFEAHSDVYRFEGRYDCAATYVIITGDCLVVVENVTRENGLPDPVSNATSERYVIDFPLDAGWSLLVVEMNWTEPSPPTADGMTLNLEPAEAPADGHAAKYARVAGESPLRIELSPGVKHPTATQDDMPNPAGGEVLRARAFVRGHGHYPAGQEALGVGFAKDFRFTLTVTVTYGGAATGA